LALKIDRESIDRLKKIIAEQGLVTNRSTEEYSKIFYILPVPREKLEQFGASKFSPHSHQGNMKNAIDFVVPEGTEVYAAADGIVVEIKNDSNVGGPDPKFWFEGNFIEIKHNGESTLYEHFKFKGVLVKVGKKVKRGQLIGYSGNTGFTHGPHLHFEVRKYLSNNHEDFVTLKARFKDFIDVYENELK
jgi:murein DD-endopeptidase MepM/ murein hydrolase activator NlpD